MSFKFISPKAAVSRFRSVSIDKDKIALIRKTLSEYLSAANPDKDETYHKDLIRDFIKDTWNYRVSSEEPIDLAITENGIIKALIEVKSPTNDGEMFGKGNQNCKALQECVRYFMRETTNGNKEIKRIIITNHTEWYVFDANDFQKKFADNKRFKAEYEKYKNGELTASNTKYFYDNVAGPKIQEWIDSEKEVDVIHFTPGDFKDDESLAVLYKLLMPESLLARPYVNDANSLNKEFYHELLHIIGLKETSGGEGTKVIERKEKGHRDTGSLLESAIFQLEETITDEERQRETALRLSITWINRLLFLKLVESQLLQNNKEKPDFKPEDYKFLTIEKIQNFDELNVLFFKVLGKRPENRDEESRKKFANVPYLNSSLFELSEEERTAPLQIRGIRNKNLALYEKTVLKDNKGKRLTGEKDNLEYIFEFLDAYNFSSVSGEELNDGKSIINASVLGLIFEKINGYKDGSYFTPAYITEYMAREAIERAVVRKFNEVNGWSCKTLTEVGAEIADRKAWKEARDTINTIRVCDPAVGSGHFLVSVLNRLVEIKSRLNIILDADGERISNAVLEIRLENDELSVIYDGEPFAYNQKNQTSQRIQEALFNEKKTIIENCLFGVDINPNSVNICRLRLWIELLKNAYYTKESGYTQLETLPNIDINIKCGNSLVSKYPPKIGSSLMAQAGISTETTKKKKGKLSFPELVGEYKSNVERYKNENNKANKLEVDANIKDLKKQIGGVVQLNLFDDSAAKDDIYVNSLEWMFEFPEVLDEEGNFLGFDVVIANPPYIRRTDLPEQDKREHEQRYESAEDQYDIYMLFIELGFELLKTHGVLCYINPIRFFVSAAGEKIRNLIVQNHRIESILDVSQLNVFASATTYPCIMIYENQSRGNMIEYRRLTPPEIFADAESKPSVLVPQNRILGDSQKRFLTCSDAEFQLLNKIASSSEPLSTFFETARGVPNAKIRPGNGCSVGLKSKGVGRYFVDDSYLQKLNLPNAADFQDEMVILPRTVARVAATLKPQNVVPLDRIYFLTPKHQTSHTYLAYVLAVLNSLVTNRWFYMMYVSTQVQGGYFDLNGDQIGSIPMPNATNEQQGQIAAKVDSILAAKQKDHGADTSKLESEIDALVYQLYGLTPEEIETVENA